MSARPPRMKSQAGERETHSTGKNLQSGSSIECLQIRKVLATTLTRWCLTLEMSKSASPTNTSLVCASSSSGTSPSTDGPTRVAAFSTESMLPTRGQCQAKRTSSMRVVSSWKSTKSTTDCTTLARSHRRLSRVPSVFGQRSLSF